MAAEFEFMGERLTLATAEEMRTAIMYGRFLSRADGLAKYLYRGRVYILSDRDLADARA
jgi:hypothetical protein